MRVRVEHDIHDLVNDMAGTARTLGREASKLVRKTIREGNRRTIPIARESAGAHGKHYPSAFTAEMLSPLEGEYGPESDRAQGDMSFNFGSRNQPPHLDIEKGWDLQEPEFVRDIGKMMDQLSFTSGGER
ncbi:hypothetical protein GUY44_07410 [Pimelobacter simplex]|uniref:Uncharacterized protein n=1 Tax=Nocardioides simplex TaxID=2045 RepID=A0A0A1DGV8_NOCSI|nr:hypothetical protein [Pimelobacter simplex]AIY15842.1 hypothetical protein KR76_01965 [Pimelobacter simplex]MCG8150301.1 hypothetical protein [Pimelobacter simplex]GEB16666.1 hypothetical protein NSI01_49810 [Pimelobacter simplex]SFM90311.1 hypothetical protein SAMN05421671_4117 [Pimelobacter simplex]